MSPRKPFSNSDSVHPVIKINNYELGIVFPLKDEDEANRVACFERPPRKYAVSDEPWVRSTFSCIIIVFNAARHRSKTSRYILQMNDVVED